MLFDRFFYKLEGYIRTRFTSNFNQFHFVKMEECYSCEKMFKNKQSLASHKNKYHKSEKSKIYLVNSRSSLNTNRKPKRLPMFESEDESPKKVRRDSDNMSDISVTGSDSDLDSHICENI